MTVYDLLTPAAAGSPVVLNSPHSGAEYPAGFLAAAQLDLAALRRSEDFAIDRLFAAAARSEGAPLLAARFPRVWLDVNRAAAELDPLLFPPPLPPYADCASDKVVCGLGVIPRLADGGQPIYRARLPFAEAEKRLAEAYVPYHQKLAVLLAEARAHFGRALLLDCHSMPAASAPDCDIVLGDLRGGAAARGLRQSASDLLAAQGWRVCHNHPYAGGFIARHYGRPDDGVSVLQIEINRALYMDEARLEIKEADFAALAFCLRELAGGLAAAIKQK